MHGRRPLTNSVGAVLDPIFASAPPCSRGRRGDGSRRLLDHGCAETRAALSDCVDKHRDAAAFERATTLAWTQAQVQLHHLGVNPGEAGLFQRLASHVIFAGRDLRPSSDAIRRGCGPQSGLWSQGISGDLPIVLSAHRRHRRPRHRPPELLQAHEYWRMKQLAVDLVILNERESSYVQDFRSRSRPWSGKPIAAALPGTDHRPGRVFVLRADLIAAETQARCLPRSRGSFLWRNAGSLF